MVESCTTVQVALRIRPLVQTEITRGCQPCVDAVPNEPQVQVVGTDKAFTYNFVFGPEENQLTFYNTAVKDLISKLFTGYNVTVLAYGQTGSGKTFSMGTTYSPDTIESNMGVIPRAINDIFEKTKEMENWDFKITVSFMELYKEQLYDLLAPTKCVVDIREDGKGIRIPGLTEIAVMSPEDTTSCLVQGSSCRATGATAMNAQSSRSHAIFTITIYQQKRDAENESMCAKFHLVDLAGSERSKKTQATGERFREGVNINRGLLALGNVISSLGEGHQKSYISYRDSKLTRLLQDSLGGNSITLMIACVSPADYNLEETLSTLRYADRARKIKNKPIINQDPKAAEIANLKHQIQELRLELLARGSGGGNCPPEHTALEKDIASLVMKNRKLTEELNDALSAGTNLFERALMAEVARDRMKVKLCELQAEYGQTMESLSHSVDQENCPATFLEQLKSLRDLQIKIQELQAEQKRSSDEIMNHQITSSICAKPSEEPENDDSFENLPRSESDIDEKHQTHTLQQAERTKELHELNQKLALKEELAAKLMTNMNQMSLLRSDYESSVKDLEQQISVLEKERDELKNVLQNVQSTQNNNNNIKVAEQRKKRLQELEQKISTLCKKLAEQEKIIKLKDKNDEKINKLNNEIQGMKQIKVKLIRQMKSENDRFRTWKLQREKELIKLKEQDRRRLNEMARMERLHTKQQNVLKRKVEEAVAVNKRLKDALAVQKSVQERRAQQHGNANKVHTWIDQEVEVLVRTVEAERTLEQLLEDRGMLHQQLDELQVRLDGSPDCDKLTINEEIKQLKEDLELRNAQIVDLQHKIMDSDQENKAKTRWDTVQSMAEAKSALKHLFDLVADMKRNVLSKEAKCEELEAVHKNELSKLQQCEHELKAYQQELLQMERDHQEKVLVLLKLSDREGRETGDSILAERLKIQNEELEKMESLHKELEEKTHEIEILRSQEKSPKFKKKRSSQQSTVPTLLLDLSETDEDYDEMEDDINDPDWQKTPIFKRIQKLKNKTICTQPEQEGAVKRTSDGQTKCNCKGICKNRLCGCRKLNSRCSKDCKCDHAQCHNMDNAVKLFSEDSSSESINDENNDPEEDNFKRPSSSESQSEGRSSGNED